MTTDALPGSETSLKQAKATWDTIDAREVRGVAWLSIPTIAEALDGLHARTTLREQRLFGILETRVPQERARSLKGAALVCGDLQSERRLFEPHGGLSFETVAGYDLSDASLDRIGTAAFQVEKHCCDVNDLVLESNALDLIVGVHGLHHVYNQGNLFYQAHKALRPEGLFYMEEWIGPPYLQIPRRNAFFARLLLFLLFSRRERTNHMGQVKGAWLQPKAQEFDPSEACNSEEIPPQYHRYFHSLLEVGYGGLLYPMFEGLGRNFDTRKLAVRLRLKLVIALERALQGVGLVKPLFVTAIGEKRALGMETRSWRRFVPASIRRPLKAVVRRVSGR